MWSHRVHPGLQVPRPAGTTDGFWHVRLFQEPVRRWIHAGLSEGKTPSLASWCRQTAAGHSRQTHTWGFFFLPPRNFQLFFLVSRHATISSAAWRLTAWCSSCCRLKTDTTETSCWTARATSSTLVRRDLPRNIAHNLPSLRRCLARVWTGMCDSYREQPCQLLWSVRTERSVRLTHICGLIYLVVNCVSRLWLHVWKLPWRQPWLGARHQTNWRNGDDHGWEDGGDSLQMVHGDVCEGIPGCPVSTPDRLLQIYPTGVVLQEKNDKNIRDAD